MRTGVQHAVTVAILCTLAITLFMATQTEVSAQTTIPIGQTQTTIPVGEYAALLEIPSPPPTMIPAGDRSYDILFYNESWNVDGRVSGGSINIYVLNNSNYQEFNKSQQYSVYQELPNVSGSFKLHVALPSNGPDGTYVFDGSNATYRWWIVFDNRAGSSNATLYIDTNENTGSYRFVFHSIGGDGIVLIVAAGVIAAVLLSIGAAFLKERRAAHSYSRA